MSKWIDTGAIFDSTEKYRYRLWRTWDPDKPTVVFCLLNPSTATAELEDPTIRRCLGYAKAWGGGKLIILNLFALRSTDPKKLYTDEDPIGPDNDYHIQEVSKETDRIVCGWGTHGKFNGRGRSVKESLNLKAYCLGTTKGGYPKHPLYLKADLLPQIYY